MSASGPIDPDRLAATEFSTAFRGYDTGEVRALLHSVGEALREAAEREHELREQLGRAEAHLRELRETSAARIEEAAEDARREGREMVAEAQRVRERMLGDLARRRRNARQQVEQLMAGRERLLEAFDSARQTIDAATQDMRGALPEARLAAEAAGRRFDQDVAGEDDEVAVAALEDEIEAARLVGLPLVAPGPEPEAAAPEPEPGRTEGSLLGERDVREMPPVELGADFEDVRIVPLEAPIDADTDADGADGVGQVEDDGSKPSEADDTHDTGEVETGDDELDASATDGADQAEGDGPGGGAEAEDPAADDGPAVDAAASADEDGAATADDSTTADADDAVTAEHDATEYADDEDADADEAAPGLSPVDPGHLDDLFASLRAARAEAVSDARSVLERTGADPDTDADPDTGTGTGTGTGTDPDTDGLDADALEEATLDDEPAAPAEPAAAASADAEPQPEVAPAPEPEPDPQLATPDEDVLSEPLVQGSDAASVEDAPDEPVADPSPPLDVEATIAAAGERLASALKRVLAVEQNELLDRLRQVGRGQRADEPGVLGDPADLVARFASAAEAPLAEVAGAAMASTGPGKRARLPAVEPLATAAATELVEPLHERLTRSFGEAGTDTAEASARARATFREWKTRRVGAGSADAARGAFHAGLLAGVGRSAALVWALDDEDAACPECADNALAGPVGRGHRFPTGHRHPPAHDGCRCTLVVAEEPSP
ncbi:MAG: DivIVA domain-containing protein [Acidimicrobiales bacterium]|nr:DivIVA domain-containing protein [Acidimicrobiales bacterium]